MAFGVQKMGRPHFLKNVKIRTVFVKVLEMSFDFSPNANVMRICSGVRISIKRIQ